MADPINLSPNMSLPIPTEGVAYGPLWATSLDNCLQLVDSHDHSSGYGVPITPSGLNINANLTLNSNNLTDARSLRLAGQLAPLADASDLACLYNVLGDLYYNDALGNQVRITQSGGVAGTPGSIAGLTSPASATYVAAQETFVFQSDANKPGNLDGGFIILRNNSASSNGLTLQPPLAMATNYAITLPTLPAAQKFLTLDGSGNMAATWAVDGTTLEIASGTTVQVKDGGISSAKMQSNVDLPGTAVNAGGKRLVVANAPLSVNMSVLRGTVRFDNVIVDGEGFTMGALVTTGQYTVNFTAAFLTAPILIVSPTTNVDRASQGCVGVSTTAANVNTYYNGAASNNSFSFIAIGLRS